jgi:hypothetical protein
MMVFNLCKPSFGGGIKPEVSDAGRAATLGQ